MNFVPKSQSESNPSPGRSVYSFIGRMLIRRFRSRIVRCVFRKQRLNLSEFLIVQVTFGSHFLEILANDVIDLQIVSINTTQTG